MLKLLTIALSNFIQQNYIDQADILRLEKSVYISYASLAVSTTLILIFDKYLIKHPVSYLKAAE